MPGVKTSTASLSAAIASQLPSPLAAARVAYLATTSLIIRMSIEGGAIGSPAKSPQPTTPQWVHAQPSTSYWTASVTIPKSAVTLPKRSVTIGRNTHDRDLVALARERLARKDTAVEVDIDEI